MEGPPHLHDELKDSTRLSVDTRFGPITGGRARNGAAVFLEVPYALSPTRFTDAEPLPETFRYGSKEFVRESAYAFQPLKDGQAVDTPFKDKMGYGNPSENPLFVNITAPPSFPEENGFPVIVYIHGGFLQFGSPHGLGCQAQHVTAARSEVRVNIGYRLSAFGFIACDAPKLEGNYGFKDQWLALLWIRDNIASFGGDPNNVTLTGLSAGAHSCHQLMHYVSRLPAGTSAPFQRVRLESNAIITPAKTPAESQPHFRALCAALELDANAPDVLDTLRDPAEISPESIVDVIDNKLGILSTFRGCLDGGFLASSPDPMTWQRSGELARGLLAKGVKSITIGHLKEEWYLYGIADPLSDASSIRSNLLRYYPESIADGLLKYFPKWREARTPGELLRTYGDVLSDGQVHLPTRLLARDLASHGMPVVRYEIHWTPPALRTKGYITHGNDRVLWNLYEPLLLPDEAETAKAWLDAVDQAVHEAEEENVPMDLNEVLLLADDRSIGWEHDQWWDRLMEMRKALPGESDS